MKEIIIPPHEAGQRLDRFLKKSFPHIPYGLWARLARTGKLRVDKKRVHLSDMTEASQVLMIRGASLDEVPNTAVPKERKISPKDAQDFNDWIIYEDEYLIAINKPASIATQGGTKVQRHVDAYLHHINHSQNLQWKLVHRLDKDTSGVLLIAKNVQVARTLTQAFKDGVMEKTYWALTLGVPNPMEGEINARLKKQNIAGQELMVEDPEGDRALTLYRVVDFAHTKAAFVELTPKTGRTHQLRAHMVILGTPIVGDPKYKIIDQPAIDNIAQKLHLHARSIQIPNLFGKGPLVITAPPNAVFIQTCDQLGFKLPKK
jgi:23S rRNA pseudouridine955/2504/2580 synthase